MNSKSEKNNNIFNDVAYWNNAIVHWVAIGTLFVNVGVIILFAFYVHPSELALKLQYNVFFGTSLSSDWWSAYLLPAVSIFFFVVDLFIGQVLYNAKERIAAYIVLLGALFTSVALLIAAISIILNNY
ncbi:MAG: hypothetical protein ABFQ53_03770 [Patescibacteria group bacterium]